MIAALALLVACQPIEDGEDTAWNLVWSDEFDGAAGTAPGEAWIPDLGAGGWGNQELQVYTEDNAATDGEGHLVITARAETMEGAAYTSARLTTNGTLTADYGRIEVRAKVPSGQGLWPAFWMLGSNFSTVGWPACGEIDILEVRGGDPSVVQASVHGPGYSGGSPIYDTFALPDGTLADDFHTYAVQKDPGRLTFWLDDRRVHSVTRADLPEASAWVFDQDFFLLLNLAVGGVFGGDPDETTNFPADYTIDYVRVSERAE